MCVHGLDKIHIWRANHLLWVQTKYCPELMRAVQASRSDLFLVFPNPTSSLSGILFCLLQSSVSCSKIPGSLSSIVVINIWTSSCPGIDGGVLLEEWSLIKWYKALYFHMVGGFQETTVGYKGQWIRTFVNVIIWENSTAFLYCTQNCYMDNWMQLRTHHFL